MRRLLPLLLAAMLLGCVSPIRLQWPPPTAVPSPAPDVAFHRYREALLNTHLRLTEHESYSEEPITELDLPAYIEAMAAEARFCGDLLAEVRALTPPACAEDVHEMYLLALEGRRSAYESLVAHARTGNEDYVHQASDTWAESDRFLTGAIDRLDDLYRERPTPAP